MRVRLDELADHEAIGGITGGDGNVFAMKLVSVSEPDRVPSFGSDTLVQPFLRVPFLTKVQWTACTGGYLSLMDRFWRKAAVQGIQAFAAYAGNVKKLALTESGTATRIPGCLTHQPLSSPFQKIVFEPSSGEISAMRLKSPHDAARY